MTPPTERERRFAEHLASLADREDSDARAVLAALRRALGKEPGEAAEAARYIFPWLRDDARPTEIGAFFEIAALFATHRLTWRRGESDRGLNMGGSFRRLIADEENPGAERRFVALLNAHSDELNRHLRHAVSLLKSKEVSIDWAQLLHDVQQWTYEDVQQWTYEDRPVQLDWARAFWGSGPTRDETDVSSGDLGTSSTVSQPPAVTA